MPNATARTCPEVAARLQGALSRMVKAKTRVGNAMDGTTNVFPSHQKIAKFEIMTLKSNHEWDSRTGACTEVF